MLRSVQRLVHTRLMSMDCAAKGRLDGRVAIVVAGTSGLGLGFAKRLAEDGAHVVVSSRKQENVDQAVEKLRNLNLKASGYVCHIGDGEQRRELLKKTMSDHGSIDILIQNAGVNPHPFGIMETPESVLDKTYEIQIKSNFQLIQEVQPYMAQSKHQGSIILTSTTMAYTAQEYPGIYAITKAAIIPMVRAFMPELLKSNIRINCLTLGGYDTGFLSRVKDNDEFKRVSNLIPMKRYGRIEESAGIVAFLCSDEASYITGENFVVAGGLYTRL